MDILERAKELERGGEKVIHLEVGEPDFQTPLPVKRAGIEGIRKNLTYYTHSMGMDDLREEIAKFYYAKYGVNISPDEIFITSGSSQAIFAIFACLIENGDRVIMTDPHYPCYPNFVKFFGGKPIFVPLYESENYILDVSRIKKLPKAKVIIVNSPCNPTGAVYPQDVLKSLAELGITVVSDEVYHGLTYEGEERTMREFTKNSFVIGGFSKAFSMTGWRLGYAIFPGKYYRSIQKIQQNFFISTNAFVQYAGIEALKKGLRYVKRMNAEFKRRRDFLIAVLKKYGFDVRYVPQGAFYYLLNIKKYSKNSLNFVKKLLEEKKVAFAPGEDFGTRTKGYIRISYANSCENIEEGIKRLAEWVGLIKSCDFN